MYVNFTQPVVNMSISFYKLMTSVLCMRHRNHIKMIFFPLFINFEIPSRYFAFSNSFLVFLSICLVLVLSIITSTQASFFQMPPSPLSKFDPSSQAVQCEKRITVSIFFLSLKKVNVSRLPSGHLWPVPKSTRYKSAIGGQLIKLILMKPNPLSDKDFSNSGLSE